MFCKIRAPTTVLSTSYSNTDVLVCAAVPVTMKGEKNLLIEKIVLGKRFYETSHMSVIIACLWVPKYIKMQRLSAYLQKWAQRKDTQLESGSLLSKCMATLTYYLRYTKKDDRKGTEPRHF